MAESSALTKKLIDDPQESRPTSREDTIEIKQEGAETLKEQGEGESKATRMARLRRTCSLDEWNELSREEQQAPFITSKRKSREVKTMHLIDVLPRCYRRQFDKVPCFVIDNVAEYFFGSERYTEHFTPTSWHYSDFPILVPPFHQYWMEFRIPPALGQGHHGVYILEQRPLLWAQRWEEMRMGEVGAHIEAVTRDMAEQLRTCCYGRQASVAWGAFCTVANLYGRQLVDQFKPDAPPAEATAGLLWSLAQHLEGVHWLVILTPFVGSEGVGPFMPGTLCFLALDAKGAVLRDPEIDEPFSLTLTFATREQLDRANADRGHLSSMGDWKLMHWFFPALFATSLLHCRNVHTTDIAPNKKASAHHRRIKGYPLVTHKVLNIDPMKEILAREGQAERLGLQRALHICRGHFADYTEGRGLFGKIHGQFWVPQHVRGSASAGTVVKEYTIQAPKSDEQGL